MRAFLWVLRAALGFSGKAPVETDEAGSAAYRRLLFSLGWLATYEVYGAGTRTWEAKYSAVFEGGAGTWADVLGRKLAGAATLVGGSSTPRPLTASIRSSRMESGQPSTTALRTFGLRRALLPNNAASAFDMTPTSVEAAPSSISNESSCPLFLENALGCRRIDSPRKRGGNIQKQRHLSDPFEARCVLEQQFSRDVSRFASYDI